MTHLAMGTRLPELARAAGLQGVTVLSDLLPFVPAFDEAEALEMLRGAGEAPRSARRQRWAGDQRH